MIAPATIPAPTACDWCERGKDTDPIKPEDDR
jgi:hypothetical protein